MTIRITYAASKPEKAVERFVRAQYGGGYFWCERGTLEKRYDVRQGTCDAEDLNPEIREAADRKLGHAFAYVEWPL